MGSSNLHHKSDRSSWHSCQLPQMAYKCQRRKDTDERAWHQLGCPDDCSHLGSNGPAHSPEDLKHQHGRQFLQGRLSRLCKERMLQM